MKLTTEESYAITIGSLAIIAGEAKAAKKYEDERDWNGSYRRMQEALAIISTKATEEMNRGMAHLLGEEDAVVIKDKKISFTAGSTRGKSSTAATSTKREAAKANI